MGFALRTEPPPLRVDADGVVRVGGTRVTLETVVQAFEEGFTAEEIVQQYPSLPLAAAYGAIGYYLSRRDEVEVYLREREEQTRAAHRAIDARGGYAELRKRLVARRESSS